MNQRDGFFQVDTERIDADAQRPMDRNDKIVIGGCIVVIVLCLLLMLCKQ